MAASRVVLLALLLAAPGALAQSVKSCGGPQDHLKNPIIKLTPDPIQKGGTLKIEASGTLDEGISALTANVDLAVQALGIVKASVKGGTPVSFSPAVVQGPFSMTIGPFSLPTNVPGSAVVKGQVHVVDGSGAPVMCIDLDMNVPAAESMQAQLPAPEDISLAPATFTSCGKPSDHMPDLQISTSGGVTTVTGTLDEAVTKVAVDVDVSLRVFIISVPLKLSIPVDFSPGAQKGAVKVVTGPSTIAVEPEVKAHLKGTVKLSDGSGEEITCLNVDTVVSEEARIVV